MLSKADTDSSDTEIKSFTLIKILFQSAHLETFYSAKEKMHNLYFKGCTHALCKNTADSVCMSAQTSQGLAELQCKIPSRLVQMFWNK